MEEHIPKKYRYINIKCVENERFNKNPVYRVFNNRSKEQLAILSYHIGWKEYVFSSKENCIFNIDCLNDVMDFLNSLKKL